MARPLRKKKERGDSIRIDQKAHEELLLIGTRGNDGKGMGGGEIGSEGPGSLYSKARSKKNPPTRI